MNKPISHLNKCDSKNMKARLIKKDLKESKVTIYTNNMYLPWVTPS